MESGRLEAFYDTIIAIIVTVLVLELPQPETATLTSLYAIKNAYFAYLISFLICANFWQYHHLIYQHVNKINNKIIWLNLVLMFVFSLIPYLTTFVSNNINSLLAQFIYGLDFIIVDILLFIMAKELLKTNSETYNLKEVMNIKNATIIPMIIFIIGLIIGFIGYPISISIACLITLIRQYIIFEIIVYLLINFYL